MYLTRAPANGLKTNFDEIHARPVLERHALTEGVQVLFVDIQLVLGKLELSLKLAAKALLHHHVAVDELEHARAVGLHGSHRSVKV